ncbi:MAG: hypothetical protein SOT07_00200 [Paludibacteraceae bacterium]|nr:hypothetical protein [Paludibacteraceae bacterium]
MRLTDRSLRLLQDRLTAVRPRCALNDKRPLTSFAARLIYIY